jgi:hypothetical protein
VLGLHSLPLTGMERTLAPAPRARSALIGALATFALTSAHHSYGAVRYATPWRHHATIAAVLSGAALVALYLVHRRLPPAARAARLAGWLFAAVVLVHAVLLIGLFEGVYNHVLKDALWLGGAPDALLVRLFPPPTYELPNDLLFEASGVLQVIPAWWALRAISRSG